MTEENDIREGLREILAEVNPSSARLTATLTVQSSTYSIYSAPTALPTSPYDPTDLPIIPTPPAPPTRNTASVVGTHLIALSVFFILALTFIAWRLLVRFTEGNRRDDDDDYGQIVGADGRDDEDRAAVWRNRMEGDGRVESWSGFVGKDVLPIYQKECGSGEIIVLETIEAVEGGADAVGPEGTQAGELLEARFIEEAHTGGDISLMAMGGPDLEETQDLGCANGSALGSPERRVS
ncbi:hypothetical protein HK097_003103 [Rhizophlyctis rosea]|uniref:Uncharacterized protein n=1 Tax=Rhizophlyctis rosea TaxID=64517 RepID=A0AAD5X6B7_9FUNG|nr:hypothetical protein HK097_003103 [Rhizophlyctis rosea]